MFTRDHTVLSSAHGVLSREYFYDGRMATKFEWTAIDYAARDVLSGLISESGLSLREFAAQPGVTVSYTRIRNIKDGEKAPVKLSEFISICEVCGKDPGQMLRTIIGLAQGMGTRSQQIEEAEALEASVDEALKDPELFGLAANRDDNKEIEAETPYE